MMKADCSVLAAHLPRSLTTLQTGYRVQESWLLPALQPCGALLSWVRLMTTPAGGVTTVRDGCVSPCTEWPQPHGKPRSPVCGSPPAALRDHQSPAQSLPDRSPHHRAPCPPPHRRAQGPGQHPARIRSGRQCSSQCQHHTQGHSPARKGSRHEHIVWVAPGVWYESGTS